MTKNLVESAKKLAAYKCIDEQILPFLNQNSVIGIGSGSTVVYGVERLTQVIKNKNLAPISCIPSSFQAQQLILKNSETLALSDFNRNLKIDITFDGADEVDSNLYLIKGGGACLTQEKILASASDRLVIIGDYRKKSQNFGQNWKKGLPIEVIPMAVDLVKHKIEQTLGGQAKLRMGVSKAGPCVTDNSNFLLDWEFLEVSQFLEKFPESRRFVDQDLNNYDWDQINNFLNLMPGIVDTGLFLNMAECCYFGMEDGSVDFVGKTGPFN